MTQEERPQADLPCCLPRIQVQVFQELWGKKSEQPRSGLPQGQPERLRPSEHEQGATRAEERPKDPSPERPVRSQQKRTEHARLPAHL